MVFFSVTASDGKQVSVNSETVRYCEAYDQAAWKRERLTRAKRERPAGGLDGMSDDQTGEFAGIDAKVVAGLRAEFSSVDQLKTTITFLDGNWLGVRETPEQVQTIANHALAELSAKQETPAPKVERPRITITP